MAKCVHASIDVWIINDGMESEFWTVALDDVDRAISANIDRVLHWAAQVEGDFEDLLQARHCSFGRRRKSCPPGLIDSLICVDGGRNVQRHKFDLVHMRSRNLCPVLGVGRCSRLRMFAARVALTCRLLFESRTASLQRDHILVVNLEDYGITGTEFYIRRFAEDEPTTDCSSTDTLEPDSSGDELMKELWL